MEIYKIKPEDNKKVIIVRPLLNAKDLKTNIVAYKTHFDFNYEWRYRYMCFALINDELKIFNFSKEIKDKITLEMLFMNSDKALKITIGVKKVKDGDTKINLLNNKYEIISDDKYRFDNTPEKREFIENLLTNTSLDLSESLKQAKKEIENTVIEFPTLKPSEIIIVKKTLKELYDSE